MMSLTPISTLFPYTTLFRSPEVLASRQTTCRLEGPVSVGEVQRDHGAGITVIIEHPQVEPPIAVEVDHLDGAGKGTRMADRKSTRLNSSHANISYAVFCLKK